MMNKAGPSGTLFFTTLAVMVLAALVEILQR